MEVITWTRHLKTPQVENAVRLLGWLVACGHQRLVAVALLGFRGVHGLSLVGHVSHEAVEVVSSVGGRLDAAVREGDHEGALHVAGGVLALRLLEVDLGVVVVDSVLVGEWLGRQLLVGWYWGCTVACGRYHGGAG